MDEDALIAEVFAPLATDAGADNLKDDAAVIAQASGDVVVTVDALAAGVHFLADDPPETIAAKALRVNLSDLAAKGAEPFGYLLALALGPDWTAEWARAFASGLKADQTRYGVALFGGDTLRASPGGGTQITITALGRVPAGAAVRRRSAKPGDILTVTGTIGDGALGLVCRLAGPDTAPFALAPAHTAFLQEAYLRPNPPVAAWRAVRDHARAAMDVSDGLLGDAAKLVESAGVRARIDLAKIPFSPAVAAAIAVDPSARDIAITGGDDYQILAAIAPDRVDAYTAAAASAGVTVTAVGHVEDGPPGVDLTEAGASANVADSRFQHF